MRRLLGLLLVCALVGIGAREVRGQGGNACPAIVDEALAAADEACAATGRNQACYGHAQIEAEAQPGVPRLTFDHVGDLADVEAIRALRLSGMEEASGTWGVGLMRLQANLPDTMPGQNVTIVLFGDVQLTGAEAGLSAQVQVTARVGVNVRQRPSTGAAVLLSLVEGEAIRADGRLEDGSWLRVQIPGGAGWVAADLVQADGDVGRLPPYDAVGSAPISRPMQAFYLTTGLDDSPCAGAPDSGILIQSPRGAGEVTFSVNGVSIALGSTVLLQAQPGGALIASVLEGAAALDAGGARPVVPAGMVARVPLDASGAAVGLPSRAEPYDPAKVAALPIQLLDRAITPAEGLLDISGCNNALGGETEASAGRLITTVTYPGCWNSAEDAAAMIGVTRVSLTMDGVPVEFLGAGSPTHCVEGGVEVAWNYPAYFAIGPLTVGDHVLDVLHDHPGGLPWWPDGGMDARTLTEHCVVHARPPEGLPVDAFDIGVCEFGWEQTGIERLVSGQLLAIGQGCSWPTLEEAAAGKEAGGGWIAVDGEAMPVSYTEPEFQLAEDIPGRRPLPDRYGVGVLTDWITTPGAHTVTGQMPPCGPHTCTFTVEAQ